MKSLQQYLIERYEEDINEGAIWDAIKNWFKELFEPTDRPYDRYSSDFDGAKKKNYISYLKENFSVTNLEIKKVLTEIELTKLISPNGHNPNIENKEGFYKIYNEKFGKDEDFIWYGIIYKDDKVKDCCALFKCKIVNEKMNINTLQILPEYSNIFTLKKFIEFIKNSDEFINITKYVFSKDSDKSIYKQLINDCGFDEEYDKKTNKNIAVLEK